MQQLSLKRPALFSRATEIGARPFRFFRRVNLFLETISERAFCLGRKIEIEELWTSQGMNNPFTRRVLAYWKEARLAESLGNYERAMKFYIAAAKEACLQGEANDIEEMYGIVMKVAAVQAYAAAQNISQVTGINFSEIADWISFEQQVQERAASLLSRQNILEDVSPAKGITLRPARILSK